MTPSSDKTLMIFSCTIWFRHSNACVQYYLSLCIIWVSIFTLFTPNPVLNTCQTLNEIPRVHQNIHFYLISLVWSINQRPTVWTSKGSEWKTLHYSECQTSTHLIVSSNDISDMCDDSSNVAHDEWKLKESRRMIVLSLSNCVLTWYCTILSKWKHSEADCQF